MHWKLHNFLLDQCQVGTIWWQWSRQIRLSVKWPVPVLLSDSNIYTDRELDYFVTTNYFKWLNIYYPYHYKDNTPASESCPRLFSIYIYLEGSLRRSRILTRRYGTYGLCWLRKFKLSLPFDPGVTGSTWARPDFRWWYPLSVSALASRLPESCGMESVSCYSQECVLFSFTSHIQILTNNHKGRPWHFFFIV